jgi:hypothetical protein
MGSAPATGNHRRSAMTADVMRLLERGRACTLMIVPSVWPLWDAVVGSTLEFRGARLRNAQPPPRAEPVNGASVSPGSRFLPSWPCGSCLWRGAILARAIPRTLAMSAGWIGVLTPDRWRSVARIASSEGSRSSAHLAAAVFEQWRGFSLKCQTRQAVKTISAACRSSSVSACQSQAQLPSQCSRALPQATCAAIRPTARPSRSPCSKWMPP